MIRPSLKNIDPLHSAVKTRYGIPNVWRCVSVQGYISCITITMWIKQDQTVHSWKQRLGILLCYTKCQRWLSQHKRRFTESSPNDNITTQQLNAENNKSSTEIQGWQHIPKVLMPQSHNSFNCISLFVFGVTTPQWAMASSFTRFLDHTQRRTTVGRTPLDEWSVRRRDLYLTTQNTHNTQTSMPPVGFEPTVSAGERPQTCALDCAATGTGNCISKYFI